MVGVIKTFADHSARLGKCSSANAKYLHPAFWAGFVFGSLWRGSQEFSEIVILARLCGAPQTALSLARLFLLEVDLPRNLRNISDLAVYCGARRDTDRKALGFLSFNEVDARIRGVVNLEKKLP